VELHGDSMAHNPKALSCGHQNTPQRPQLTKKMPNCKKMKEATDLAAKLGNAHSDIGAKFSEG